MSETRRGFIRKMGAMVVGGVSAAALLESCASAGLPAYRTEPRDGSIDLYLKWYPELSKTGGAIQLLVGGELKLIYVIRTSFSQFAAISPICPHQGCTVGMVKNMFKCPCHGSTYDLDGSLITGPADKPLRSFRTQYQDTSVKIFLS